MDEIKLNGADILEQLLTELPDDIAKKVGVKAIKDGAKIILEEAQNLVPEGRTGKLADSLAIKKIKMTNPAFTVYARRKGGFGGWHANLVEFGTKPHNIRNVWIGGKFFKLVKHPGTPPRPFMRPALMGKQAEAVKTVGENLFKYCSNKLKKGMKK